MNAGIPLSLILGLFVAGAASAQTPAPTKKDVLYPGTCEPSAAVILEPGLFVVGDDDKKDLLVYRKEEPGNPEILKISHLPGLKKKADLEGAARIGNTIYWIGSHSRKNDGTEDLDRHRLFAIEVEAKSGSHTAKAIGKPYESLIEDLQKDSRFDPFPLAAAAKLAPGAAGGLNIEGLAATPGGALLVGFRNPVPDGKAFIVSLDNPRDVLAGKKPVFGAPIQLDLGGLGIRSLEYWLAAKTYLIIAGSFEDGGRFQAFRWSGPPSGKPQPIANAGLESLVPEAIFFDPAAPTELVILSDDGDTCPEPPAFRSRRVELPKE